jgi:Glycosyl transferase family, a/b domain
MRSSGSCGNWGGSEPGWFMDSRKRIAWTTFNLWPNHHRGFAQRQNHFGGSRCPLARDRAKHPHGVARWWPRGKCRQPEKGILAGEITGAKRDPVVINAASGFVVAGLARDLNDGIALAREQIDSGCAPAKVRALRNYQPKVSA